MDGFTGFNPTEFCNQIMEFKAQTRKQAGDMSNNLSIFGEMVLAKYWCSPKAVSCKPLLGSLLCAICDIEIVGYSIVKDLVLAYDSFAQANGLSQLPISIDKLDTEFCKDGLFDNYFNLQEADENGNVGMYKEKVQEGLNEFIMYHEKLSAVEINVPISVFDPNGDLQAAYQARLAERQEKVKVAYDLAKNSIETAINEEMDGVIKAKTHAIVTIHRGDY